jgi:hypothetical protein
LVYAFRRVPEPWEFEVRGYTNVSGGLDLSPEWKAAESAAAAYHKRYAIPDAVTRMKNNARATMTATGPDRLVKVKPVIWDPDDSYPPGSGIVQWRVSELAGERGVLLGDLLTTLKPGDLYPLAAR